MQFYRTNILLYIFAVFLMAPCFSFRVIASDSKMFIMVDGLKRSYYLHTPKNIKKSKSKYPLLIVLHGGGQTGKDMIAFTRFDALADRDTAYIAYPNAEDNHWNDGRVIPQTTEAAKKPVDDVRFISSLIEVLVRTNRIDGDRICITGVANGAIMSYRLACELSDKIKGIAPVLGSMPKPVYATCKPVKAVNIFAVNGSEDKVIPFNGGYVMADSIKLGEVVSINNVMSFWANYGTTVKASPFKVKKRDLDRTDGTTIITETFTNSSFETEVILYNIKGGGHAWPGAPQIFPPEITGKISRETDSSKDIWNFFMNLY